MSMYGGAAMLTGFAGYNIGVDEAALVAKPASRILNRHPEWAAAVTKVADPAALLIALATITLPRIAAHSMMLKMQAQAAVAQSHPQQQAPQPQQPPSQTQAPTNGFRETPVDLLNNVPRYGS